MNIPPMFMQIIFPFKCFFFADTIGVLAYCWGFVGVLIVEVASQIFLGREGSCTACKVALIGAGVGRDVFAKFC